MVFHGEQIIEYYSQKIELKERKRCGRFIKNRTFRHKKLNDFLFFSHHLTPKIRRSNLIFTLKVATEHREV